MWKSALGRVAPVLILWSGGSAQGQDPNDLVTRGRTFVISGRYVEALAVFDSAVQADGRSAAAWAGKASSLHQLYRYPEALDAIERAVAIAPDHFAYVFNRGLTKSELGDIRGAVSDLDRSISLRPSFAPAWTERGAAKALLGLSKEAESDWTRSWQLDSSYIWPRYYRGLDAIARGKHQEAIVELDVVARQQALPSVHLWRWVAYAAAGRKPPDFQRGADAWPAPVVAYLRGELSASALIDAATRDKIAGDDRRIAAAHYYIAQKQFAMGDRRSAEESLWRVLAVNGPRHAEFVAAQQQLKRLR